MNKWICCQLGAREHYAIPRVLHRQGQLKYLITDVWVSNKSALNLSPKSFLTNFKERYHPELEKAKIESHNNSLVLWEISQKYQNIRGWDKIIARNQWWQEKVLQTLEKLDLLEKDITLFTYSYAALELLKYAKKRGWKTVLGQIDPGIIEEKLVFKESQKYSQYQSNLSTLPLEYWKNWRQELTIADRIIVNSPWSSKALQQTGVSQSKIEIIPLAYQSPREAKDFKRNYPQRFNQQRPLKVLFLGQVILRKGIAAIFEAIKILEKKTIEFCFVGEIGANVPHKIVNHPQITWIGSVSRNTTKHYYQQADVFLFPTLSDGFGLTQLEAQAWGLPVIASEFCGSVVKDRINGLILPNVTGKAIAKSLDFCLNNPQALTYFSLNTYQEISNFNLSKLTSKLSVLENKCSFRRNTIRH